MSSFRIRSLRCCAFLRRSPGFEAAVAARTKRDAKVATGKTTPDTTNGTGILTDQLGWCQGGQWGGIYGSPMECLGTLQTGHTKKLPWHRYIYIIVGAVSWGKVANEEPGRTVFDEMAKRWNCFKSPQALSVCRECTHPRSANTVA